MTQSADFLDFLQASPSSYHAAAEVARRLEDAGFTRQDEAATWDVSPGGHVMVRGGAVMAWVIPPVGAGSASADADSGSDSSSSCGGQLTSGGFRIIGSHTDSPGFMVKPTPDFSAHGWRQVAVEVYGGPILHTWLDRELTVAGQVVLADGSVHLINTGPLLRIPNVAIHLQREAEFKPSRQQHTQPVLALGSDDVGLGGCIGKQIGVDDSEIAAFNLVLADAQRGVEFGAGHKLIAAGRMDNLSSVYASMQALIAAAKNYNGQDILVLAGFDHEEVGSNSRYGAAGPLLEDVLTRTAFALGANAEGLRQMYARSSCISADAAHSIHPNYAGKHDPTHLPIIGSGPVTKINANQHYASDATTIATWELACQSAGVPTQRFVSNNDVPCGTTIGPLTATRLGIATVDVGVPMLSMHSARELIGVDDLGWFVRGLEAYLTSF